MSGARGLADFFFRRRVWQARPLAIPYQTGTDAELNGSAGSRPIPPDRTAGPRTAAHGAVIASQERLPTFTRESLTMTSISTFSVAQP